MMNAPIKKQFGGRGLGRKKGSKNIAPALRDMIAQALDEVGGVQYLVRQANENPKAFLSLLARLIPTQITGDDEQPARLITTIKHVIVDPQGEERIIPSR